MKPAALFVSGILLMLGLSLYFTQRILEGSETQEPALAAAPESSAAEPKEIPRATEAAAPERSSLELEKSESEPKPKIDLTELNELSLRVAEQRLRELIADGNDEALETVLAYMIDTRNHHAHKSKMMARLLADLDDPRIFSAAAEALENCQNVGIESWVVNGYQTLIATNGGIEGEKYLIGVIGNENKTEQVRLGAVQALAKLGDPQRSDEILELAKNSKRFHNFYFDALLAWEDPQIESTLWDIASGTRDGWSPEARNGAFYALGKQTKAIPELRRLVESIRTLGTEAQDESLGGLGYALSSLADTNANNEAWEAAAPFLSEALLSVDKKLFEGTVQLLKNRRDDINSTTLAIMRTAAQGRSYEPLTQLIRYVEQRIGE